MNMFILERTIQESSISEKEEMDPKYFVVENGLAALVAAQDQLNDFYELLKTVKSPSGGTARIMKLKVSALVVNEEQKEGRNYVEAKRVPIFQYVQTNYYDIPTLDSQLRMTIDILRN